MKLLIKIYLDKINIYDLEQLVLTLNSSIEDKDNTNIYIMTNTLKHKLEFETCYLDEHKIQIMINHNLSELEWDLVLPIMYPYIISKGFDTQIKDIYKQKFKNTEGVLFLSNDKGNNLTAIGREYYEKFGHIYNPIYTNKNFENEFIDIMKLTNKYYEDNLRFKIIEIKTDDDNIYEMRKKMNFGIY